jgi:phosphatidate cytidylyltransferase
MLGKRLLTIAVALPLFAAALLWLPPLLWALLLMLGLLIAAFEWCTLSAFERSRRMLFVLGVMGSAVALLVVRAVVDPGITATLERWVYAASVMFWIGVAPFWVARRWQTREPAVLALAGWIVLVPMWLALARLQATPGLLLLILSVVWIADSAAYLSGRRWGRHKLAPVVSPGKSWEGVAGAAAVLALYYLVLWFIVPAGRTWFGPALAAALFAALLALSIEGDLFESWMKRQAGVKDSGQLLPGHGGILDRIDGLASTLPAAALLVSFT